MLITPSFKKSLIVEQFQGNYLKSLVLVTFSLVPASFIGTKNWPKITVFGLDQENNKKAAHEPLGECVTDVLNTF